MAATAEGGRGYCGEGCAKGDVLGPAAWKAQNDIEKVLYILTILSNFSLFLNLCIQANSIAQGLPSKVDDFEIMTKILQLLAKLSILITCSFIYKYKT
jgi:hypothetical protein